ncbi:MAG: xanthine dehydrogenase family protein molybdopterin-binding subunit, partial [Nocardioidaceae bacterium]|nr:xanthine dehydrogenase family protein molybdopterin-binding subunit [Nocardioidaceae bacterium]
MTAVDDRPATDEPQGEVGTSRRRKEDQRLITGRTRWTDNLTLPGMLHLAMVRSPFAHAHITSVDLEAARSSPGVVAVLAGSDLAAEQGTLPNVWNITPDQKTPTHPSMAVDTVRFAGEIVACVVARSAAAARDAVELVDIDYDELPVLLDTREALKDETVIHPEIGTNESAHLVMDFQTETSVGDVDAVIEAARADGIVFERSYEQQRLIPAFME